jgi:hypothetical protein
MLFQTCVLGLVGLRKSGLINDSAAEVRDNWLPSTVAICNLNGAIQDRVRAARCGRPGTPLYGESITIGFEAGTADSATCVMQVDLVVAKVTTAEVMTEGPS